MANKGRGAPAGRARLATWVFLGSAASGCASEAEAALTQPERLPAFALRIPPLGCFGAVPRVGDCQRHADCGEEERCGLDDAFPLEDRAPPPLTCREPRGAGAARARCEEASDCASGLCALGGVCLDPCGSSDDCGGQQHCRPVEVRLGEAALAPVMACVRTLVLPSDVQLTLAPSPGALRTGRSELLVPGVTDPAIVFAQGDCANGELQVTSLRSNDLGRELYRRGSKGAENPVLHDGSALAALMFPNNPAILPSRAGLMLEVRTSSRESRVDVVVAARPTGASVLDLNIFYVGGGAAVMDGGFRPGEPRVARMLSEFDSRFQKLGLAVGTIREYEVVGALREELSVLEVTRKDVDGREVEGRPQRLDELFSLSAGVDDPGINVFLVSDMGSYIGIAGGIPGVLGIHGTARSGVALAADLLGDLRGAELVLMHEIGHFLGLFHTTESSGNVLDPLSDTTACPIARDEDENRELASWECRGYGSDNLMFWTGSGGELSPQQVQVMASSVVLR